MDPWIFLGVIVALYCACFFIDRLFKSCMHYPYDAFLKNTGLTVQFLRLRWHTTAFNRAMLRWGNNSGWMRLWLTRSYTVGVLVSLSLLPIGIILLFITIFNGESSSTAQAATRSGPSAESGVLQNAPKVEILLPGVNLPLEEVGYYALTLLLCTIVHEFGHALAAVQEDIPVIGFGFQLYLCLPFAYTEISTEHLNALKWFKKLRIICAGIWHNFLFALFCYLLLSTLGYVAAPFYTIDHGVVVTEMTRNSPLLGTAGKGLMTGDIVTQINDCKVNTESDWYHCLRRSIQGPHLGYCVSHDFIRYNDESIEISHHSADGMLQCCDERNEKLCCFESVTEGLNSLETAGITDTAEHAQIPQHVCLDVRRTIEDSHGYCSGGVSKGGKSRKDSFCQSGFCLRPLLRNTTTILTFKRTTGSASSQPTKLRDVIYIGHPADVSSTVRISPFVPRQSYVSPQWGDTYALFLKYNVIFSFGQALLNAIPCFGLDGYHITSTIVHSFLVLRVTERPKRDFIALLVAGIGTILFGSALLKVLWMSVIRFIY
ncbi:membrane-bound transcription factor site-2 protease [Zeugodacus cucurbitae]|uniref:Membrane-bound transcription factor site-2 protease n=1 Tax=Zeugodacus cucurbitae TaxID=28588 RepID=A0A0A1WTT7_ZEUCU|nr:membrane-bound transcription factor site-2 protease [Zeugodacus cucurbitae]XP_054090860.1 membrane-bound transcription factor site-2 protease [Zeugodacus cucurbitae]